jgi:hypothetical protein
MDYVYLVGGYIVNYARNGVFLKIVNPEGLHLAIGYFLISRR